MEAAQCPAQGLELARGPRPLTLSPTKTLPHSRRHPPPTLGFPTHDFSFSFPFFPCVGALVSETRGALNPHLVFLDIEIAQVTVYICPWFRFLRKMKE